MSFFRYALLGMYAPFGPTTDEETLQYAPPEVLLGSFRDVAQGPGLEPGLGAAPGPGLGPGLSYDPNFPLSYDIWSVGVVFLEIILGTADVFTVDQVGRYTLS